MWTGTPLLIAATETGNLGNGVNAAATPTPPPIAAPSSRANAGITDGVAAPSMAELCQPAAMQAIAAKLDIKVTIGKLPSEEQPGPFLEGGTRFTPARGDLPAYCQVTGSFVTNPATGKTANFLATLPISWNRKYLQLGCGGHCGTFAVSDAASPTITITNQGKPGDSIRKGYASFATDEGHAGFTQGKWAIKGPGEISQDYLDDYLYRSQKVLAMMGKEFTTAFYAKASGTAQKIAYSYFCGCSGGGRDALVAAAYFPEAFDGIVSGSPYANLANLAFLTTGASLATVRSPDAGLPASLVAQINPLVMAKCDAVDGVKDGLIQNPMACDFRPEKDLPRCADNKPGPSCFTQAQIESVSTVLTAATDKEGRVVQPGYSVSELQNSLMLPPANAGTAIPGPIQAIRQPVPPTAWRYSETPSSASSLTAMIQSSRPHRYFRLALVAPGRYRFPGNRTGNGSGQGECSATHGYRRYSEERRKTHQEQSQDDPVGEPERSPSYPIHVRQLLQKSCEDVRRI
ncbi:tannase/feruloyl esterase family alpha/beta hydrolase [Novosphingobium sp. ST904]|uniref:tannase/feruloyl esterase family alpha/beta hydrolase n=1 Tax=Novosphingobium sp. ST904 TaxID=1684385 RepID=UPI0018D1BA17|nr:tannase/feruloyl esterase family alpha/beta hydrolase [Novosphingobium sp. ST904]